ncbi:MAG: prepilin peptidase [Bacillota bacterium]
MPALIAVLGLVVGSFLNVVIHRLPRGEDVVRPPSRCPVCGTRLAWHELVPVLSYLVLRGRCRHCGERISPRYPLVEALTAALFLLVYLVQWKQAQEDVLPEHASLTWVLLKSLVFTAGLICAAFIDAEHGLIPNRLVLALLTSALVVVPLAGDVRIPDAVLGALGAGGALLLLGWASRGGMGGGDIKLAAVAGLYLGWPAAMLGLFFAAVLGTVAGVALIVSGKKSRKDAIPFGPYLAAGFLIALLWGREILNLCRPG